MKQLSPHFLATSIGAILLSAAGGTAFAQAPTNVTPQDINQASPPERDGSRRVVTTGQGTISLCPFADSAIPVTINRVEIEGGTILSPNDVEKSYAGIRGQATTLAAICDIRESLIVSYRNAGFPLTRVELPEQRIGAEGVIRFRAIEAGLTNLNVVDNAKSAPFTNVVTGFADRLKANTQGKPLKWAEVERFALLMRDTPGLVARLELRPGATTPVAETAPVADPAAPAPETAPVTTPATIAPLDLFVTVEPPERFGGFISLQRNSADVFGRYAGAVGGQIRGLMPWGGDELSGVLYSTQTGRQAVAMAAYEWRHATGLTLKGSLAYAETKPGRDFAALDLKGQSTSFTLSAAYPFILRSAIQLEGTTALEYVDQDNFIFEDQSISNDKVRVSSTKLSFLWRDVQERRARASAQVEYRQGLESLDASQLGDPTLSRIGADPQATVWRARVEGEYRLRRNWPGVAVAADMQEADDILVSYEQYQVGNLTFGRGYDPGTVTGDKGYGGRIEVLGGRYTPEGYDQFSGEPYVFHDWAHTEQLATAAIDPERDLGSWGGGLRFRYADRASLDIGVAQAVHKPSRLSIKEPPPQFLMNLAIQF
jgi:hemolysin activation/secretion protein